jgi:hypothetical protein
MAILRIRVEQIQSQSPDLTSLAEQLNGMGKPHYQFIRSTDGTAEFTVDKPYQPGSGELKVYLNGQKVVGTPDPAVQAGDYHEVDSTKIRFLEPLYDGDIIEFQMEGKGQGTAYVVDHYHAYREKPIGDINGVNKIFFLSRTPRPNTELVFVNGNLKDEGADNDYVIEGNKITFTEAPATSSKILVNYDQQYVNA